MISVGTVREDSYYVRTSWMRLWLPRALSKPFETTSDTANGDDGADDYGRDVYNRDLGNRAVHDNTDDGGRKF